MPAITERIIRCEQGSKEWFDARCGCLTASRIGSAIAKLKCKEGEAAERRKLRYEILGEQLSGNPSKHVVTDYMERGIQLEGLARVEYGLAYSLSVEEVGFVYHPEIKFAGCSPDGLVDEDGLVEIKVPKLETHLEYRDRDEIPEDYLPQMLWQLACCDDRKFNDFFSFCPELPDKYQRFRKRLERTDEVQAVIRGMEAEAVQFLADVENLKAALERRSKGL